MLIVAFNTKLLPAVSGLKLNVKFLCSPFPISPVASIASSDSPLNHAETVAIAVSGPLF